MNHDKNNNTWVAAHQVVPIVDVINYFYNNLLLVKLS